MNFVKYFDQILGNWKLKNKWIDLKVIQIFVLLFRLILVFIFLAAPIGESFDLEAFYVEISNYKILPGSIIPFFAFFLIVSQISLSIMLLVGIYVRQVVFLLSGMLVIFMFAIGRAILMGEDFDCGCFVKDSFLSNLMGETLIEAFVRDIVLLLMSGFVLIFNKIDSTFRLISNITKS